MVFDTPLPFCGLERTLGKISQINPDYSFPYKNQYLLPLSSVLPRTPVGVTLRLKLYFGSYP